MKPHPFRYVSDPAMKYFAVLPAGDIYGFESPLNAATTKGKPQREVPEKKSLSHRSDRSRDATESAVCSRITIAKCERHVHRIQIRRIQRREMQLLHLDGHEKSVHFHHSSRLD